MRVNSYVSHQNMAESRQPCIRLLAGDEKSIGMNLTHVRLHQSVKPAGRCRMIFSDLPSVFSSPVPVFFSLSSPQNLSLGTYAQ